VTDCFGVERTVPGNLTTDEEAVLRAVNEYLEEAERTVPGNLTTDEEAVLRAVNEYLEEAERTVPGNLTTDDEADLLSVTDRFGVERPIWEPTDEEAFAAAVVLAGIDARRAERLARKRMRGRLAGPVND
jgi:hypothetical protein